MPERRGPDVAELERALAGLAERIDFPQGDGLARAVARRLERETGPAAVPARAFRSPLARRRRMVLALTVGLLLLAAAAVAAVIRVGGVELRPEPTPSSPPATPSSTPTTEPPDGDVEEFRAALGPRVSLAEADAAVDFRVLLPAALGEPDQVRLNREVPGGMVSLVYLPGPGLPQIGRSGAAVIVTQFGGMVGGVKEFRAESPPVPVEVHGVEAFYVEGFHTFVFTDDDGEFRVGTGRRVGSTLIWQEAGAVIRIESDLPLARVLEIAESMA